jgi:hypothetical protein
MVMIPTDVGVQVRTQTEAGTHPIRAIGDIPSDLPELLPGQVFRARIQEVLPENTYRAVVAGRLMTLSLPEGAKAGDTLELVMVSRSQRSILAQRSDGGAAAVAPFENASLSRTGQLIAGLLAADGEPPPPASFARGAPVLARVPANAAEIVRELPGSLSRAVAESGMFYESHQVQWALGQRPLTSLLLEPQGQLSQVWAGVSDIVGSGQESALATRRDSAISAPAADSRQGQPVLPAGLTDADAAPAAETRPLAVPEELRTLVQQQLEAGASNRLVWMGEVWPGQDMEWEIHRDAPHQGAADPVDVWQTRLRLELPQLGLVDVRLQFGGGAVNLMISAASGAAGDKLQTALPALQDSFAAAGLTLSGAQVGRGSE